MDVISILEAAVVGVSTAYVLYSLKSFTNHTTSLSAMGVFCWSVIVEKRWSNVNRSVSKTFLRPQVRCSLWSVLFFPLCLWSVVQPTGSSVSNKGLFLQGFLLILNPIYLAWHLLRESILPWNKYRYIETMLVAVIGASFAFSMTKDWLERFGIVMMVISHLYLMRNLLRLLPKTFSYGELVLVSQLIVYFVHKSAIFLLKKIQAADYTLGQEDITASVVLALAISAAVFHNSNHALLPRIFYLTYGVLAIVIIIFWLTLLHPLSFKKLFSYVSRSQFYLLSYWLLWSVITVAVVIYYNRHKNRIHSDVRKFFHIVMVGVYLPGLLYEPNMLALAAWVALALLLILEQIRMYGIRPLSSYLESNLSLFLDKKDSGPMLVTHIYLLIGFSVPVWLSTIYPDKSWSNAAYVSSFAGLLSLGIGDTVASVVGTRFGRTKLPGNSGKSVEGTVASVVAQIIFVACLDCFDLFPLPVNLLWPITLSSLYEAFTDQIDNLTLPLFTYSLLRLTS